MTSDTLRFSCPYCEHEYVDDLEVLDHDEIHEFKCEECAGKFYLLIEVCEHCETESLYLWKTFPGTSIIAHALCTNCTRPNKRALLSNDQPNSVS